MASGGPSRCADNSSDYLAMPQPAEVAVLAQARQDGSSSEDPDIVMLASFQELERISRKDFPYSSDRLMAAVLAGERILEKASNRSDQHSLQAVFPLLIGLLVRRSRWDRVSGRHDLERAISLATQWRDLAEDNASRSRALHMLGTLYEEQYEQTANETDLQQAISYLENAVLYAVSPAKESYLTEARCLSFKTEPNALTCILYIPLEDLPHKAVSFAETTKKRFRFIDARSLATRKSLRVLELNTLPKQRYVALSYVWRGSHAPGMEPPFLGTMSIEGAVGADPISIDVLITICKCVATFGCELLWIDGICIIQNDEEDKSWQIQNMFNIYKHCKKCLVLPGGLSRLVSLTEPTSWIHRSWTLQEAVAPESSAVLFSWTMGDCILQTNTPVSVSEVEPGKAAQANLYGLLTHSIKSESRIYKAPNFSYNDVVDTIGIRLLADDGERALIIALLGAIDYRGQEGMRNAIWRSSLMRVASRPADTVFSIMGLMGVALDPLVFDPMDRGRPTVALMQAMLRRGDRAEWLAAAPDMDINRLIPTLPIFPKISAQGMALIHTEEGEVPISKQIGDMWWRIVGAPQGDMQDDGTLVINAPIIAIRRRQIGTGNVRASLIPMTNAKGMQQEVPWYICPSECGPPFAVQIGKKERYLNGAMATVVDPNPFIVMLIEGIHSQLLRNVGYATVSEEIALIPEWYTREVAIAGGQI